MICPVASRHVLGCAVAILFDLYGAGAAMAQDEAVPASPSPAPASPAPASPETMLAPDSPLAPLPDLGVAWPDLATAEGSASGTDQGGDVNAQTRYSYRIEGIDGIDNALFQQRFDALSALKAHQDDAANAAQIDRRAREDSDLLVTLLRGLGYYDARVTRGVASVAGVPQVTLSVEPGKLYRFDRVTLNGVDTAGDKASQLTRAFGIAPADPVDADKVAGGEQALRAVIADQGFPFAKVGESSITVDHATQTATLDLAVEPGGERVFGHVVTRGRQIFSAHHIEEIARFRAGEPYNAKAIDDLRRALIQTSLVSTVDIKPVEGPRPGVVDIAVAMERAPPRTISGALGYGTGEGVRAEVSWTHRNLFPPEGGLTIRGVLGTQEQSGGVTYRRNNFHGRDRVLTVQAIASNVRRNAYQATSFSLSGSLERQTNIFFQKAWTWSLGGELTTSDERDRILSTGEARRRTFFIAALPTSLNYDGSDDLLNPSRGFRLGARFSPEFSLQGAAFGYARVQLDASAYRRINEPVVVAGRVRIGSIIGSPRDAIAPSRRYYAGGGASVRGYGYQDIGPRDPNNDPIGGRSLAEFSIEARVKAFGNFGVVPFFDGGNIYTSPLPRLTGFRYGAGVGVRYYTSFGPIRVDIGTPINPQRGDPRVAVYVSLGQAF